MAQIALDWEPGAGQSGQILPTIIVTNECKCLPLLWHFPFNHSKRGSWSFCKQQHWLGWEAPWGFENCGLDCIKHSLLRLSRVLSYLLRVWGDEGASGIDPLRSGSILDHFIGVDHRGFKRPPTILNTAQAGVVQPPMRPRQQIILHLLITTFLWTFPWSMTGGGI